jgi:hypothetical protein
MYVMKAILDLYRISAVQADGRGNSPLALTALKLELDIVDGI